MTIIKPVTLLHSLLDSGEVIWDFNGNYGPSNGAGKWVMKNDPNRGIATRGGHVGEGSVAGIYSLSTSASRPYSGNANTSFRCVLDLDLDYCKV